MQISNQLPAGWTSSGCYTDSVKQRTLKGSVTTGSQMTQESCVSYCSGLNYGYAGVEYAGECYCSNSIATTGASAAIGDCNMACSGNNAQACGGSNRINVFHNGATPATAVAVTQNVNGWASIGCFTDGGANARTLTYAQGVPAGPDGMTVEACTSSCQAGGYTLAGVEYSIECYCGNAFSNGGGKLPDLSSCNMPCAGNSSESCGGPNRLNVYDFNNGYPASAIPTANAPATSTSNAPPAATPTGGDPDWAYLGCYTDSTQARTLMFAEDAGDAPTAKTCIAACVAAGYTLAGVEYGGECYCDNKLNNNGGPAPDGAAGCNMPCNGDASQTCGGPNRLSMYTPASKGWQSLGCYSDSVQSRSLSHPMGIAGGAGAMTNEACQAACTAGGYKLAGTEYSGECYCDNVIGTAGKAVTDGRCNMPCNGKTSDTCGGSNGLSLYSFGFYNTTSNTSPTTTSAAASATTTKALSTSIPTGWTYSGCYTEQPGFRIMVNQQPDNQQLTIASCIETCSGLGYSIAGMEYMYQCFCDNYLRNAATLSAKDSDCAMSCTGSASDICGGPNLVSVYSQGPVEIYQPPKAQNKTGKLFYRFAKKN